MIGALAWSLMRAVVKMEEAVDCIVAAVLKGSFLL